MSKHAVLFDLDGTLHDSHAAWQAALKRLAIQHADDPDPAVFRGLDGLSTAEAVETVLRRLNVPHANVRADVLWLEKHVAGVFRQRAAWHPGALDLVRDTRASGLLTALVTSSSRLVVDSLLPNPDRSLFDTIVSGDDVANLKPAPDPYLLAAHRLGVRPADCVAIEDSLTGVTSAVAAGCRVVQIGSLVSSHLGALTRLQDRRQLNVALLSRVLAE